MSSWKEALHSHAVQPIQQSRYTVGKNATDSALIIDAMDLLHSAAADGICIVSSDSDYTRLATRIREQGLFVMGIGRSGTPKSFVNACELFVYSEILSPPADENTQAEDPGSAEWTGTAARAVEMATQEDGWAFLGAVGSHLLQRIWGPEKVGEPWLVRDMVRRLRRKLGDDADNPIYIFTEPRVGYRMPEGEGAGEEPPITP